MSEIKWVEGFSSNPRKPYDYPEGYSELGHHLFDDLYSYKLLGEWEEVKQKIPKELHRRKWIPAVISFRGEKGTVDVRFTDGEYVPMRTIIWILQNDKILSRIRREHAGD